MVNDVRTVISDMSGEIMVPEVVWTPKTMFADKISRLRADAPLHERASFLYFLETCQADFSMPGVCLAISESMFLGGRR